MRVLSDHLKKIVAIAVVALSCLGCGNAFLPTLEKNPWQVVHLDTESTFSDIAFTDSNRGWLVGNRNTLLETIDGGETWGQRDLDLDEQQVSFVSVSFEGDEGWIAGQPNALLHTTDAGKTWSRVSLSEKLPGQPFLVTALGPSEAELATDVGAIYRTKDGGKNWKALVLGAVGVVRNMTRNAETGGYAAVSSRGNFYSTWQPGELEWQPYNRQSSRRLQNIGFDKTGGLWVIERGGQIQFSPTGEDEDWQAPINPEFATSWGLLDAAFRTSEEMWVTGGGGNLLVSLDKGETWYRDSAVGDVPSNFYRIVFNASEQGFVLGQDGYLLRYSADKTA